MDKNRPNGIKIALHPNQKIAPLLIEYYATSEEFIHNVGLKHRGKQVPDISDFKEPHTFVQKLADEVEGNLTNFCRYCNENRNSKNKVEAISLLPLALRKTRTIKGLRKYLNWANQVIADGGISNVGEAIALVEGKKSTTIYREQWEKTTNLFALAGFGLAPDTNLFYHPVRPSIPAVLFELEEKEKFSRVNSDQYRFALTTLALGSYILRANGDNMQKKREVFAEKFSKIDGLTEHEQKSLAANFEYLNRSTPDQSFFQRIRLEIQDDQKLKLREIVVDIAKVTGEFKTNTVATLETFYEALKIDRQFAYADLHAGEVVNPTEIKQTQPATESAPKELSTIWTETTQKATSSQAAQQNESALFESSKSVVGRNETVQVESTRQDVERKDSPQTATTSAETERKVFPQSGIQDMKTEQKKHLQ